MQFSKSFYCSSSKGSAVRQAWGRFRRQSCIKSFKVKWTSVAKASTITPPAADNRQRRVKRTSYSRWAWQARQHCAGGAEGRKNEWISCPVRQQRKTLTFNVAPGPENWQMWRTLNEGRKLQASLTHRPLIVLTQIDWDTGEPFEVFWMGKRKGKRRTWGNFTVVRFSFSNDSTWHFHSLSPAFCYIRAWFWCLLIVRIHWSLL